MKPMEMNQRHPYRNSLRKKSIKSEIKRHNYNKPGQVGGVLESSSVRTQAQGEIEPSLCWTVFLKPEP